MRRSPVSASNRGKARMSRLTSPRGPWDNWKDFTGPISLIKAEPVARVISFAMMCWIYGLAATEPVARRANGAMTWAPMRTRAAVSHSLASAAYPRSLVSTLRPTGSRQVLLWNPPRWIFRPGWCSPTPVRTSCRSTATMDLSPASRPAAQAAPSALPARLPTLRLSPVDAEWPARLPAQIRGERYSASQSP